MDPFDTSLSKMLIQLLEEKMQERAFSAVKKFLEKQMNLEENNFTCQHCIALQKDFEFLQLKEEKLRNKLKSLENRVHDLQLKNDLLEEENKTLRASQMPIRDPNSVKDEEHSKRVLSVLNDFDALFSSQGSQITHLIEDRDHLAILSFNALSLLSKQETIINKFENATKQLLAFISNKNENLGSAIRDFSLLGFDVTQEIAILQRLFFLSNITINNEQKIDDNEIIDIVKSLAKHPNDQRTIQKILTYITTQSNEKDQLRNQIKKEEAMKEKEIRNLNQISEKLHISSEINSHSRISQKQSGAVQNYNMTQIFFEIKRLKKFAHDSKEYLFIIHEMVNILTKSAQRSNLDDENILCSIKRLKRWLDVPETRIDLGQEINFLLTSLNSQSSSQSCYQTPQTLQNTNLYIKAQSPSPTESFMPIDHNAKSSEIDCQLYELTKTVEELKQELMQLDHERKSFINQQLKGTISQNTSWKKICSYLLKKASRHSKSKNNE